MPRAGARGHGRPIRFRRAPHLVSYWRNGALLFRNYATGDLLAASPFVVELLTHCSDWTAIADLAARLGAGSVTGLRPLVRGLVGAHLLEQEGRRPDARVEAMRSLDAWNPEAGFFHATTRNVRFLTPAEGAKWTRTRNDDAPMPAVVKRYRKIPSVALPKPMIDGEFPRVLTARRTWRRFSKRPVDLGQLATLLGLTSGIQQWVDTAGQRLALKTSPSGGARHSLETYIVVREVQGLPAGVYHYAPDRHAVEKIRGRVGIARMRDYLPNSGYFANASAIIFFTALFERILWRYPYSRAYRAALVEAGHLCQTFCLTATWLGLAPYCVMGLADTLIEGDLGIDGIRESVLYATGVGRPPGGAAWAPLQRGTLPIRRNPRLS